MPWGMCVETSTARDLAKEMKNRGFPPRGYGWDNKNNRMFKMSDKWRENWESFADKKYVRPVGPRQTIGQTVAQAQEILIAMLYGYWRRRVSDGMLRLKYNSALCRREIQYPQSLGELCLEVAAEKLKFHTVEITPDGLGVVEKWGWRPSVAQKIKDLRRLLYRRNF